MHVFLDTAAGMTAGAPLWGELQMAMDASRYFVLIASPVAASRPWVNKEIAYWLNNNTPETLIIVAAQGEVSWDSGCDDFDWSRTDSLPQALRSRYQDEPIFVDMRKVKRPLDYKDPVLNDKIADVAARLRGVTKEELTSRDRQTQRSALRLAASAIMVLVISLAAALAASFIAVGQRNDARAQARLALSRQLAAQSHVLLSQSADLAALLAVESYRINPDTQARGALFGLLSDNSRLERIRRLPLSDGQLTRDGTAIIVPGYRGVSVWSAASGRRLGPVFAGGTRPAARSAPRNRLQYEADLSPDDRRLAVYTPARTIELWDLARHRLLAATADPAVVTGGPAVGVYGSGQPRLVYSRDGRYILSTGMDGAYVFDARTLRMIAGPLKIPGDTPGVDGADFDPEGGLLILSGLGGDIIFRISSWRAVSSVSSGDDGTVDAAFSPDGRQLAVMNSSGVQLYDVTPGRSGAKPLVAGPEWTMNGPQNQDSVAWSPDGLLLAASGNAGALVWNPATGQQLAALNVNLVWNGGGDVSGLAFTHSGRYLLDGEADGLVTWQVNHANLFSEGRLSSIGPPAFSGDGKVIATADGADGVQLWDAASDKPLGKPIRPGGGTVQSVAFIPGGTTLAIGEQTGTAIWNMKENRQILGVMTGFSHTVDYVSASSDGRYVAAAENLDVSIWDLATRRMVLKIPAAADNRYSAMQAAISPDGNSVAVPAGEDVELWSIPQRKKTAVIKAAAGASVNAVAFAHAGKFLAVNTSIPTTRLWDLKQHRWTGLPMSNGIGSAQSLNNNPVAISPDGTLIASASGASNSVTLWDSGSRAQIGVLTMPQPATANTNTISGVAFSPDGRTLAVTTNTGILTVWDLNVNHWIANACAIAGRGLTRSEWAQYIGSIAPYRNTCG